MSNARIRLGELLVRAGVLDETRLKAALAEQARWGGRLGKVLVEMGFLPEPVLVKALSKQLGMPQAELDHPSVPPEVLARLDAEFAELNAICPERFDESRGELLIAMADPLNVNTVDLVRARTGFKIRTSIAGESQIQRAVRKLYDIEPAPVDDPADWLERTGEQRVDRLTRGSPELPIASGVPVVLGSGAPSVPAMSSPPKGAPPPAAPEVSPNARAHALSAVEMARALESAQKNQIRAIRALVELLLERGAFTREEYLARIQRR